MSVSDKLRNAIMDEALIILDSCQRRDLFERPGAEQAEATTEAETIDEETLEERKLLKDAALKLLSQAQDLASAFGSFSGSLAGAAKRGPPLGLQGEIFSDVEKAIDRMKADVGTAASGAHAIAELATGKRLPKVKLSR